MPEFIRSPVNDMGENTNVVDLSKNGAVTRTAWKGTSPAMTQNIFLYPATPTVNLNTPLI
jgi:hypothetical protein